MKIQSALVKMSGKIGNWVASKNKGGGYFRTQNVVLNPNTPEQAAQRTLFANITKLWAEGVNPGQKKQWDKLGEEYPIVDRLGQVITLTGNQMFNRVNLNRATCGVAPTVIAPTTQEVVSVALPEVTMTTNPTGEIDFGWDSPSPLPADTHLVARAIVNLGAGRRYFTNRLRIVGVSPAAQASSFLVATGEVGLEDSYVGWGISTINSATGARSPEATGRSIITLAP